MVQRVRMDLHVHSALSLCGAEEMKPPATLLTAEQHGIAILGIVDHCTAGNARAYLEASAAFDVRVFVGLEVESSEGVHLLTLFSELEAALELDAIVASHLPHLLGRTDLLGPQLLLDEWGEVIGTDDRLLIVGTDLDLNEIARLTAERDGMAVAAHVDRKANGLLPTLGFIPPDLGVRLFEVSRHTTAAQARATWPQLSPLPVIRSSDAHHLHEIGAAVTWISADLAQARITPREFAQRLAEELLASREVQP